MDLSLMFGDYAVTEAPGLDTLDPRLSDITELTGSGEYTQASNAVSALLAEGICDIRLIGYLAYGPLAEHGPAVMQEVAQGFAHILDTSWDAFGPIKRKEKSATQSIVWFVKQAMKRLQRESDTQGADWARWTQSLTPDDVDACTAAIRRLQGSVDSRLGAAAPEALEALSNLRGWMEGFRNAVGYPEPEPEPDSQQEEYTDNSNVAAQRGAGASGAGAVGSGPAIQLGGSPYLHLLLQKIEAFNTLVEKGEFKRALIVADDVHQALEGFNPMLYFPQFFKSFAKFQALYSDQLMEWADYRDTPEWIALRNFFLVDIEEFTNS